MPRPGLTRLNGGFAADILQKYLLDDFHFLDLYGLYVNLRGMLWFAVDLYVNLSINSWNSMDLY